MRSRGAHVVMTHLDDSRAATSDFGETERRRLGFRVVNSSQELVAGDLRIRKYKLGR